ncbi:NDP-sugar synthase [Methylobacter sp. S3L5C]|uniref:nucleotidyltransferase family protein n=1 Tax=Methylobacter sp. S3L5C TaxID=2839024 RepID=UPI001FABB9E4|nr:NDP-sugar synthase [Methylobacter sp. S3L5C]UOA09139.1 NDP-sugar synthase [Methylobacter sp. S3L5C]
MDVIIFADRKGQELLPLTEAVCVPLLPVAGKMVIEYTLEALVDADLRKAHIILSPYAEQVKKTLGNGDRWGIQITYSTSRGEESPIQALMQLQQTPVPPFLILRGDIIRSGQVNAFLQQAQTQSAPCVHALFGDENAYMLFCRDLLHTELDSLNWVTSIQKHPTNFTINLIGSVAKLDSLAAFHQANLDAAVGRIAMLLVPGRQTSIGLTQGRNTQAYPQNLKQGIALIGSNCHLHPSVELSGEVVIGDNVIIDRLATIESCVILPHTYIGELVELRNAIVRGNDLIRVDNGSILKISDAFLLADLKTTTFNKGLRSIFNRVAGLTLLLLSLPLWVFALVFSLLKNPAEPYCSRRLRGNKIEPNAFGMPERTEFTAGEWQISTPVLRYLPRILAVISGDLTLIGTLPVSIETAALRTTEWENLADQAPAGLLGPTQLHIPIDASEDEKLMSDSFYAAHFNLRQDLRYLLQSLQALVSRKAWFG